jgi:septum formation protein
MTLVLASASPRRRELLAGVGITFRVMPSDIDEEIDAPSPRELATELARRKGEAISRSLAAESPAPFVLSADTIVVVGGDVFNKPRDDRDAARMIAALSGRTHEVMTAIAVSRAGERLGAALVASEVLFRALDPRTIDAYVATGEGRDKAGAYAVQGIGGGLVRSIRGSYHNVVGLPLAETIELLLETGAIASWP